MIPFDFFYSIYYKLLFEKLNCNYVCQDPVNLNSIRPFRAYHHDPREVLTISKDRPLIICYDQEPIDVGLIVFGFGHQGKNFNYLNNWKNYGNSRILIHSEYSNDKDQVIKSINAEDVHYWYHALLCFEWYRNYWYQDPGVNYNFETTYITYNNLILDQRLYRANLLVDLHQRNIFTEGKISFNSPGIDAIAESANQKYISIPAEHKNNILDNIDLLGDKLYVDTTNIRGELSAEINIKDLQSAFVHLVTETVFYNNKVHLTEKIFKPIVAKVPFLLLAGPGNIAYIKRYGFKTFSDYWSEEYDNIIDPVARSSAVVDQLEKLCNLTHKELVEMRKDMSDILEYNYNHFYKNLRPIVVNEFVENLTTAFDNLDINYSLNDVHQLKHVLLY